VATKHSVTFGPDPRKITHPSVEQFEALVKRVEELERAEEARGLERQADGRGDAGGSGVGCGNEAVAEVGKEGETCPKAT